jgi:RND family efflux transporter MFP subunit
VLLVLLSACGGDHAEGAGKVARPEGSGEVLVVESTTLPDMKPLSAVLTNRDVGGARARTGGTLLKLSVREGDLVEAGQVIAIIADERRTMEASAGASAAAAAEARAIAARAQLKRVEELFAQGVYAEARLDTARAEAQAAEAQLKSAQAGGAALAEVVNQGRVLAPAAGKVTRAPVPQGAVVMPGEIVAEIATGRRVLRAELPEADRASLRDGDDILVANFGGAELIPAKILQIYPAVQDGKIVLDIDASGLDGGFVGMRVSVRVPIGARESIFVPSRFVTTRYGVDYVRLMSESSGIQDVPVQIGSVMTAADGALTEILAGLRPGDRIIAPPPPSSKLAREES